VGARSAAGIEEGLEEIGRDSKIILIFEIE
jgi:hypothetical protein